MVSVGVLALEQLSQALQQQQQQPGNYKFWIHMGGYYRPRRLKVTVGS